MGRSGLKKAGGRALTEDSRSSSNRNSKSSSSQKPKSTAKSQSKSATPTTSKSTSTANESLIPLELQQLLLDVFRNVFENALSNEDDLKKTLQEVKGALYERDFEKAFGKEEFLEAYAVRWSPVGNCSRISMQSMANSTFTVKSTVLSVYTGGFIRPPPRFAPKRKRRQQNIPYGLLWRRRS